MNSSLPLIAHIIYRLDVGGLENGLVNLIASLPRDRYRHAIICLTGYTDYRRRLRDDCQVYSLEKQVGNDLASHLRLWRLLRRIRPQLVHTRNLPTLEYGIVAALAGVKHIVHGEHGRDVHDLDGASRKYRVLRRVCDYFIDDYIALSKDLQDWLVHDIGIAQGKVRQIYNGVDSDYFMPATESWGVREELFPAGFIPKDGVVVGTIGRLQEVKDHANLVQAFIFLLENEPSLREHLRLVIAGAGPLYDELWQRVVEAEIADVVWMPGNRDDVLSVYRGLDIFVLPSLREGVSNTLLEAMACGLPVVATAVGGNPELVLDGVSGFLVAETDPGQLAAGILRYIRNPDLMKTHGAAGRRRVESMFSMAAMSDAYQEVYDSLLQY